MRDAVLNFVRKPGGGSQADAYIEAIKQRLEPIAHDLAELRKGQKTGLDAFDAQTDGLKRQLGQIVDLLEEQPSLPDYEQVLADITDRIDRLRTDLDALLRPTASAGTVPKPSDRLQDEIAACRNIAPRGIFILGFARSSTTITEDIVNSSNRALVLGEPNWHMPNPHPRFRDWYNQLHAGYGNQITKNSYAPDFVPSAEHCWWEWLQAASPFYEFLGAKLAFSSYHFQVVEPRQTQAFFEARFFASRYIFMIRNPIQTMLSAARLFSFGNDEKMIAEIKAWLRFVQFWADFTRTFPKTLTLLADDLGPDSIATLQRFLDFDLGDAHRLLDPEERHEHLNIVDFPTLSRAEGDLNAIFALIRKSLSTDPMPRQTDRKWRSAEHDIRDHQAAPVHLARYYAWALAEDLLCQLEGRLP